MIREEDAAAGQPIFEEPRRWWRRPSAILTLAMIMAVVLQLQLPRARADSRRVMLEGHRFSPERIDVSVGDTVVWEAKDDRHTVTARNGEFDSGRSGLMSEDDDFRWQFTQAGTYRYFCRIREYQGMQGEVVVIENPADRAAAASSTTTSTPPVPLDADATAPSSTTTIDELTTTTTSRPLATSSTVNLATTTTRPVTEPITPHEPPAFNPEAQSGAPPEASMPGTPAAVRRHPGAGSSSTIGLGLIVGLSGAAAGTFVVSRGRGRRRRPPA